MGAQGAGPPPWVPAHAFWVGWGPVWAPVWPSWHALGVGGLLHRFLCSWKPLFSSSWEELRKRRE